ncbi:MAG: hypothetical protein Fur0010_22050 [Bdellovibrio sp.]
MPPISVTPNVSIPDQVDWGDIKNKELVCKKLGLLSVTKIASLNFQFKVSICSLHIQVNSTSPMPLHFTGLLTQNPRTDLTIDWYDCHQFNMESDEFENEAGQDTLFFNIDEKDYIVQRDFVATKIAGHATLISDHRIIDGIQNLWRALIPRILLKKQRFVFHCSAVQINNKEALLFMGPSGVGKSTIYKNSPQKSELHDDMNIVEFDFNRRPTVQGAELGSILIQENSPFAKKFLIRGIHFLEQADSNQLVELSSSDKVSLLIANMANYFWPTLNKEQVFQLMNFCHELSSTVPISLLKNYPDLMVWQFLKKYYGPNTF